MLKDFLHEYLDSPAVDDAISTPLDKFDKDIYGVVGFHSHVHYRDDQFQVQVFRFYPDKYFIVPEHTHPNVHSFEVGISGDRKSVV